MIWSNFVEANRGWQKKMVEDDLYGLLANIKSWLVLLMWTYLYIGFCYCICSVWGYTPWLEKDKELELGRQKFCDA